VPVVQLDGAEVVRDSNAIISRLAAEVEAAAPKEQQQQQQPKRRSSW
jgi:glutathione S-transferase